MISESPAGFAALPVDWASDPVLIAGLRVDDGTLVESWRQQPGTPVYGAPYGEFENEKGTPASAEVIGAALAAATLP